LPRARARGRARPSSTGAAYRSCCVYESPYGDRVAVKRPIMSIEQRADCPKSDADPHDRAPIFPIFPSTINVRSRVKAIVRSAVTSSLDSYSDLYLREVADLAKRVDAATLDELALSLALVRHAGGRLFVLGIGGGAAHASH